MCRMPTSRPTCWSGACAASSRKHSSPSCSWAISGSCVASPPSTGGAGPRTFTTWQFARRHAGGAPGRGCALPHARLREAARALEQGQRDISGMLTSLDWDVLRGAKAKAETKARAVVAARDSRPRGARVVARSRPPPSPWHARTPWAGKSRGKGNAQPADSSSSSGGSGSGSTAGQRGAGSARTDAKRKGKEEWLPWREYKRQKEGQ